MQRVGVPQAPAVLAASLGRGLKRFRDVHEDLLPHFLPLAEQLLATLPPQRTLATALALICGPSCAP